MSVDHCFFMPGRSYFFTIKTHQNNPLFNLAPNRHLFMNTLNYIQLLYPFEMPAWVLLPDHFHCIWNLPLSDMDYGQRWRMIKDLFSIDYNKKKLNKKEIWMKSVYVRQIQDEQDYLQCIDFIHYNPIHHGLTDDLSNWIYSSFEYYLCSDRDYEKYWRSLTPKFNRTNYGE